MSLYLNNNLMLFNLELLLELLHKCILIAEIKIKPCVTHLMDKKTFQRMTTFQNLQTFK